MFILEDLGLVSDISSVEHPERRNTKQVMKNRLLIFIIKMFLSELVI
tara:strand:- start:178721 stop:178861 length:141 start_codon:yes stop_codon:yes gene_type:complete